MDLGGSAISGDGTRVYQPGRLPGALPAHLWRRRIAAVYSSRLFAPKAHKSVCPFPVCLLCAGIFLERRWGIRWWDYSGHFLNINGRICLLGALVFGLGGTALVCLFLPFYEKCYQKISKKWRICLCLILLLVFAADGAYCAMRPNMGEGITM